MRVASVFDMRPDAIVMAPVIEARENSPNIESIICSIGQHREKHSPLLKVYDIKPGYDLAILLPGQSLISRFSRTRAKTLDLCDKLSPDRGRVHGETTTVGAAALAAFHNKNAVGHVEAGIVERVGSNRKIIVDRCLHYLRQPEFLNSISKAKTPYGDCKAA